ncbi:MAG: MGMT family protein [Gammaproteobacteria bacterium]|nr:MGMT family protein [Gammaproteobacteria bacterium]
MAESDSVAGEPLRPDVIEAGARERIHLVVAAIPAGCVSTYGDVAAFAGLPRRARLVGRTLSQLTAGSRLPWHRVLRADGRIAIRGGGEDEQQRRLLAEGIAVRNRRVEVKKYRWQP